MSWIARRYTFRPNTWFSDETGRLFPASEIEKEFHAVPFTKTANEVFASGFEAAWKDLVTGKDEFAVARNNATLARLRTIARTKLVGLGNERSRINGPAAVEHFLTTSLGATNVKTRMMKLFADHTLPIDPKLLGRSWADTERLAIPPGTELHIRIQVNEVTGEEVVMMNPKMSYLLYRDFDGDTVALTTWLESKKAAMKSGAFSEKAHMMKFPAHSSPNLTYIVHRDKQDPIKVLRGMKTVGSRHPAFQELAKDLEYYFTDSEPNRLKAFQKIWEVGARNAVTGSNTNKVTVTNMLLFRDFLASLKVVNEAKYNELINNDPALVGLFTLWNPLKDKGITAMALESSLNQKTANSSDAFQTAYATFAHEWGLEEGQQRSTSARKHFESLPVENQAGIIALESVMGPEELTRRILGVLKPDEMRFVRKTTMENLRFPAHDVAPKARNLVQELMAPRTNLRENFAMIEFHNIEGVSGQLVTFRDPFGNSTNARFKNIQVGIHLPNRVRTVDGKVIIDTPQEYFPDVLGEYYTKKGIGLDRGFSTLEREIDGKMVQIDANYIFKHNNMLIKAAGGLGTSPGTLRRELEANPYSQRLLRSIVGAAETADNPYRISEMQMGAKKMGGIIGQNDVQVVIDGGMARTSNTNMRILNSLQLLDLGTSYSARGDENIKMAFDAVEEMNRGLAELGHDPINVGSIRLRSNDEGIRFGLGTLKSSGFSARNQSAQMKTTKQLMNGPLVKARLVLVDLEDFNPEFAEAIFRNGGSTGINRPYGPSEGFLAVSNPVSDEWSAERKRSFRMPKKSKTGTLEYNEENYTFDEGLGKWVNPLGLVKDQAQVFSFESNQRVAFMGIDGTHDKALMAVLEDIGKSSTAANNAFQEYLKDPSSKNKLNKLLSFREEQEFEAIKDGKVIKSKHRLWMDIDLGRATTSTETALPNDVEEVIRRYQGNTPHDILAPYAVKLFEQGLDEYQVIPMVEHVGRQLQAATLAGMDPLMIPLEGTDEMVDGLGLIQNGLGMFQQVEADRLAAVQGRLLGGVENSSHLAPILREAFAQGMEFIKGLTGR